jgi:vacuolar protein sorting-associated protein 13D
LSNITLVFLLCFNVSKCRTCPRINCDINLEHFTISYTERQHQMLQSIFRELERNNRAWKHRHSRPRCSVLRNPSKWWNFAIHVHLDKIKDYNKRRTKDYICRRAKNNVLYAKGYAQKLSSYYGTDYYLRPVMERVEQEYSFEELRILREAVHDKLKRESKKNIASKSKAKKVTPVTVPTPPKNLKESTTSVDKDERGTSETSQAGWIQWAFPSWGGWTAPEKESKEFAAKDDIDAPLVSSITEDVTAETAERIIEEEVWNMVAETSAESVSLLKKDVVFAHITFFLNSGTLQLLGDKTKTQGSPIPVSNVDVPQVDAMSWETLNG